MLLLNSCSKVNLNIPTITGTLDSTPTSNLKTSTSFFLGHKGAGSNNYNDMNMEHSIASFKEALALLDGVEIDVQMSLDNTLWMFHDVDINNSLCTPGTHHKSIITMHDSDIAVLNLCSRSKKDRVYKFSELMDLWRSSPKGFFIDIEIKDSFDSSDYYAVGGEMNYLTNMASSFNKLFENLNHNSKLLMIEDYSTMFTTNLRTYPIGKTLSYFLNDSTPFDKNVENAMSGKFDGVSCNFQDSTITAAKIKEAHDKGLQVILWTPYYDSEVLGVYNLLPDFIDTDHTTVKQDLGLK